MTAELPRRAHLSARGFGSPEGGPMRSVAGPIDRRRVIARNRGSHRLWSGLLRSILRVIIAAAPGVSADLAGEVPSPLFHDSETEFLRGLADEQFDRLLELHLLEYSVDSTWAADWVAGKYASSGLLGAYGSISSRLLFVDSQVALNVFPHEKLQLRYEWKAYQEKRFDVTDQHLDALWYPSSGWALVFTGWPTHLKEESAGGLGFKIGKAKSARYIAVRVVDDRLVYGQKTESALRFTRTPVRVVADGSFDGRRCRITGFVDFGLAYEAVERFTGSDVTSRGARGYQRFADMALEGRSASWTVGGRVTLGSMARRQDDASGTVLDLDRFYARLMVSGRRELGSWTVRALAGFSRQVDDFSSPRYPSGSYGMSAFILGAEGSRRVGRGLDLRAGYLGNFWRGTRTGSPTGILAAEEEHTYTDKVHARAMYSFRPRMAVEFLLSHTLGGAQFGGASLKALLAY